MPLASVEPSTVLDLSRLYRNAQAQKLLGNVDGRYNIDGYVAYLQIRDQQPASEYLQVFRSGALEMVDAGFISVTNAGGITATPPMFPPGGLESLLIESVPRWLDLLAFIGAEQPVAVLVGLLGVKNAVPRTNFDQWKDQLQPVDRDTLFLPEMLIDNLPFDAERGLQPLGDAIWNAVGIVRSPNRGADGSWQPRF